MILSTHAQQKDVFNFKLLVFLISGFFVVACMSTTKPVNAAGPTYISSNIDVPTTWNLDGSPYVIDSKIDINAELIIESGVVVKFRPQRLTGLYPSLRIDGNNGGKIIANGTESLPIIFTSYYDNEDDSSLGTEDIPQVGDWGALEFWNDESVLNNTLIRYGGNINAQIAEVKFDYNSLAEINNSTIELGQGNGIFITNSSQPILDNLIIQNNNSNALYINSTAGSGVLKNSLIKNNLGLYVMNIGANSLFSFENNNFENNINQIINLSGSITREVVWQNLGLPYLVNNLAIASTGKVQIEPGSVFKFPLTWNNTNQFLIKGELDAQGTVDQPIIFTSFLDDSVMGDSNNDGNATLPAPNNWGELAFENASATSTLDYVEIRYAGEYHGDFSGIIYATNHYDSIYIKNSAVNINHSKIINGGNIAILVDAGSSFDLQNSEISQNLAGIFVSSDSNSLVIKNNSFFDNTNYALSYSGTNTLDARENWWGENSGPEHPNNPAGTGDKIIGNNIDFDPWIGKEPEPVILIPGIMGSWNLNGVLELDPILHTYDNLWSALKNAGYQEGVDLFAFPYNWRLDNAYTAQLLKDKIDEVQNITGKNKVDIIAHSMGGLVTRYYIENELFKTDNDGIDEIDIDQVIFLGTPHLGATKSYLTWEGGELGPQVKDFLMEMVFSAEADYWNYSSLFEYIQNLPMISVKQLLPIYDYLKDKDTGIIKTYPNSYPANEFLQDLNLPEKLEKMSLVRGLNVIGKMGEDSTINVLRVEDKNFDNGKWEHGYPENYNLIIGDHGLEYTEGDETVPNRSNNNFINFTTQILDYKHDDLPTEAQKIIINELTGQMPSQMIKENIFKKWLVIREHSPVDLQIIDPNGKKIGKDFLTGQILNEIAGAFYSGYENVGEFIVIPEPLDGEYKILTQGLADGIFGISTGYFDENFEESIETNLQNIPTQINKINEFNLYSDDWQIQPADNDAPTVTFTADQNSYLKIQTLHIQIEDLESGLEQVEVKLDGQLLPLSFINGATETSLTLTMNDYYAGAHVLNILAQDTLGNTIELQKDFEISVEINQVISDAWSIWYKTSATRNAVIDKLVKIRNNYKELAITSNPAYVKYKITTKINELKSMLKDFKTAGLIIRAGYNVLIYDLDYLLSKL